ncbi:hypothetical protein H6F87_00770 [Cyanobacteria bacterium FACHB-502]|nr:hypothetical protein [Cyanobacteria bacterium FACHB-502]
MTLLPWQLPKRSLLKPVTWLKQCPKRLLLMGPLYTKAIAGTLGADIEHAVRSYLENPIEQSCQKIKQRYYTTLGLGCLGVRDDFAKHLMNAAVCN